METNEVLRQNLGGKFARSASLTLLRKAKAGGKFAASNIIMETNEDLRHNLGKFPQGISDSVPCTCVDHNVSDNLDMSEQMDALKCYSEQLYLKLVEHDPNLVNDAYGLTGLE